VVTADLYEHLVEKLQRDAADRLDVLREEPVRPSVTPHFSRRWLQDGPSTFGGCNPDKSKSPVTGFVS
jgi:hypothetical protein